MALQRKPREEQATTLRIVAPTQTATPPSNRSGRVGALSALARSTVRLLSYAAQGALMGVFVLVAAATLPTLFGYHTYVVQGGSMGDSLKDGSVAVSKPTSPFDLEIGDIIVRRESEANPPILHRIVQITVADDQPLFITQGDVNQTPDTLPVAFDGLGDRVVFSVPYAGYILQYSGSGLGPLLFIGAPLVLLAAMFFREKRRTPRQGTGPGTGTAAEGQREEPFPLKATPSAEEEEAIREAAAVFIEPAGLWRRTALLLILLPLAMILGMALADAGRWAGIGSVRTS